MLRQSLKDTFADNLPAEIEKVKKLRKYVDRISYFELKQEVTVADTIAGTMATRSLARSPSTRRTVVPVVSRPSCGKVPSSTLRRVFASVAVP